MQLPLLHADRLYIGGEWVVPSSDATIEVTDSASEEVFRVAEAMEPDIARAAGATRVAFDDGPWLRLSHAQRSQCPCDRRGPEGARRGARAGLAARVRRPAQDRDPSAAGAAGVFDCYAGWASTFPFEEPATPSGGGKFGLIVREPVGVVGTIIPWNAPLSLIAYKVAPALLAGCTVWSGRRRRRPPRATSWRRRCDAHHGRRPPQHLDRGWYVEPTVFGNVETSSAIAQEEIFVRSCA